jgi:hypothetical protein
MRLIRKKILPAVPESDLALAIRNVVRSATDGNTPGFMLAYTADVGFGFNFLVLAPEFSAALYSQPTRLRQLRAWTWAHKKGSDSRHSFVGEYLQNVAGIVRANYIDVISHFADRTANRRFQPWERGRPGTSCDNDEPWRTDLWPLVLNRVARPMSCKDVMPSEDLIIFLKQLRGHATEGMIVLNR